MKLNNYNNKKKNQESKCPTKMKFKNKINKMIKKNKNKKPGAPAPYSRSLADWRQLSQTYNAV